LVKEGIFPKEGQILFRNLPRKGRRNLLPLLFRTSSLPGLPGENIGGGVSRSAYALGADGVIACGVKGLNFASIVERVVELYLICHLE